MGGVFGKLDWILGSTIWSHFAYEWVWSYLKEESEVSVLEIGPGYGTMSLTMLREYSNFTMNWLLYSNEISADKDETEHLRFERELQKIAREYPSRVSWEKGIFELDGIPWTKAYDLIILTDVFEHFVLYPIDNLKILRKHLSERGVIVLTTPNIGHIYTYETWGEMPRKDDMTRERYVKLADAVHAYQYNYDEMKEIISKSGLVIKKYEVSDSNTHNFLLVNSGT